MKRRHKISKKRIIQVLAVMLLLSAAVVMAKYIHTFQTGNGVMTSDKFYFTVDLIGDSTMVDSGGENPGNGYKYENVQEETWNLYGGGAHEITFELRNYYDDLRITKGEIRYTVSVEAKTPTDESGNSSRVEELATVVKTSGDTADKEINGTLNGGPDGKAVQAITLSIQSALENSYKDGTEVTVTIQSTAPYEKTMKLHFLLYRIDTYLCYEIRDSIGSPYAELVMMADSVSEAGGGGMQPYLTWAPDLSIDNTNGLTYKYNETEPNGLFTQQPRISERNMQLSRALRAKESESLYFFKSDVKKNYTKQRTIVNMNGDNEYVIPVGESL